MSPILKDFSFEQQFVEHLRFVIFDAGPQGMMMRPFDHRNGVDLNVAQFSD